MTGGILWTARGDGPAGECGSENAEGSTSVSVSVSSPAGLEMLAGLPDRL